MSGKLSQLWKIILTDNLCAPSQVSYFFFMLYNIKREKDNDMCTSLLTSIRLYNARTFLSQSQTPVVKKNGLIDLQILSICIASSPDQPDLISTFIDPKFLTITNWKRRKKWLIDILCKCYKKCNNVIILKWFCLNFSGRYQRYQTMKRRESSKIRSTLVSTTFIPSLTTIISAREL